MLKRQIWSTSILFFLAAAAAACSQPDKGAAPSAAPEQAAAAGGGSAVPGVTPTEIKLGAHTILSGPAASWGAINLAAKAYFDSINDQGGIFGRKIKYLIEDDGFDPSRTPEVIRKLVEKEGIFATFANFSATHLAVKDYLADKGVPDLFVANANSEETNPVAPTRFVGAMVQYDAEGEMMGSWVAKNFRGKRIGLIYTNDGWGKDVTTGVKRGLANNGLNPDQALVETALYDVMSQNINTQILKMKKAKADVVIIVAIPTAFIPGIKFATENGFRPQWVASYTNQFDFVIQMAGADALEGLVSVRAWRSPDPADPAVAKHIELLKKYAPNVTPNELSLAGQANAEMMVEALKRAGPNLTREKIVQATQDFGRWDGCTVCIAPVTYSATDHRAIDIGDLKMTQVRKGKWSTLEGSEILQPAAHAAK